MDWERDVQPVLDEMDDYEKLLYSTIFEVACWEQGYADKPHDFRLGTVEMGQMSMWGIGKGEGFKFDPRKFWAITCSMDDEGGINYWTYRVEPSPNPHFSEIIITLYGTEGSREGCPPDDLPWRPDVEQFVKDFNEANPSLREVIAKDS